MIRKKTLAVALPTAKVLFLSHYSPIQKPKGAYKNINYPLKTYYKSATAGGLFQQQVHYLADFYI